MRRYGLVDIPTEASDINAVAIQSDGVVSGGIVTWTGTGLVFNISACTYYLNGTLYSSPFSTKTLSAADPTNPRIDVFAVNTSGQVVVIEGTPAVNPIEPEGDTPTTLGLTNVTIAAGATTPSNVTRELIYDENASSPTEWTKAVDSTGGGYSYDFADTTQFYTGTKSIKLVIGSFYINTAFYKGSSINISTYQSLSFAIRLTTTFDNRFFRVRFYNSTTQVGIYTINTTNVVGFNPNLINQWQVVIIPLSAIVFSASIFDNIHIYTSGPTTTYFLDTVQLTSGINNPSGTSPSNSFGFVNATSGTATATIATDTLSVVGTGLATTSATGKTLTIAVPTPIPSQTGNNGKFLTTNGTTVSWGTPTDTGITSLNSQTGTTQTFATGTSGTDFGISSAANIHTFNVPTASATNRGLLSSSDWTTFNNKQNTISLTTTGTSGAATLIGSTLNIPQYQGILTNPVTGSGTLNYISKFTATGSTIGNSLVYDNGTTVAIGTASPSADNKFQVEGRIASNVLVTSTSSPAYSIVGDTQLTYASGGSISSSNVMTAIQGGVRYTVGGNLTIPNSVVTASIIAVSGVGFSSTGTITQNQAGTGIRAIANIFAQWSKTENVSGTVTHISNLRLSAFYTPHTGTTLTVDNYYGIAIEDQNQFSGVSITNKWAIYQEGLNDNNYFNGKLLVGTTTDAGYKLDVVGTARAEKFQLSALNTAPATSSSTGTTGEIRIDSSHIYVCTATNTWKRVAIATF